MDLYCQRCGEPWDFDSVYHGDLTPEEKERFLKGVDCPACKGKEMCKRTIQCEDCEDAAENSSGIHTCTKSRIKRPFRAQLASALSDVLGDDTDGIAAEMEDAEWMFGSDFWE